MRKKRRGEWCLQRDRLVLCHWHMRSRCIMSRTCRQSKSKLIGNLQKIRNRAFNLWIAAGTVVLLQMNHSNPEHPTFGIANSSAKSLQGSISAHCRETQILQPLSLGQAGHHWPRSMWECNEFWRMIWWWCFALSSSGNTPSRPNHPENVRSAHAILPVRYVTQSSSYVCRFWARQCVGRANSKPVW